MVKVIAQIYIANEADAPAVLANYQQLADESRKEDGCHQYDIYQDNADPTHLIVDELWESEAHLMAHTKTAHYTTIGPKNVAFACPNRKKKIELFTQRV